MTDRARNSHRPQAAILIKESFDADDRIEFESSECRRRIIEIDLSFLQLFRKRFGQRIGINFQSDAERCFGADAGAYASLLRALIAV